MDIAVEIRAEMCESCGLVVLRGDNPAPVRDARRALERAQAQSQPVSRGSDRPIAPLDTEGRQ